MQLEIQLVVIDGQIILLRFQLLAEIADRHALDLGHAFHIGRAQGGLDHPGRRAAAAVAEAVGKQPQVRRLLFGQIADAGGAVSHVRNQVHPVEVRDDVGSVDAPPDEGVGGELVAVVPAHLGGVEVLDAALLHDLRDRPVVAEGVREPEGVGAVVQVLFGEPLTVEELADHRLAARDVAVAFDIDAAVRLVASLGDALLHLFENRRIIVLHPFAVQRGGLDELIARVLLHQSQRVGVGARAFAYRFRHRPEPGGIHVAVTEDPDAAEDAAVAAGKERTRDRERIAHAFHDFFVGSILRIQHEHVVDPLERLLRARRNEVAVRQTPCRVQQLADVEDHREDLFVARADLRAVKGVAEGLTRVRRKVVIIGVGVRVIVSGVAFEREIQRVAGFEFAKILRRVVTADKVAVLRVEDALRRAVQEKQLLVAAAIGQHIERLPVQIGGHGEVAFDPEVLPFFAPVGPRRNRLKAAFRDRAQMLRCEEALCVSQFTHRLIDQLFIDLQRVIQLLVDAVFQLFVVHKNTSLYPKYYSVAPLHATVFDLVSLSQ